MTSDIPTPLWMPTERYAAHPPPLLLVDIARELFDRARRDARLRQLWAMLRGRSTALPRGPELLSGAFRQVERPRVIQQVQLVRIVGSEGRSDDFDQAFRPLKQHIRERWQQIAVVWMMGVSLPPVYLTQLGEIYILRDGHHRVSVARAFGATAIAGIVVQRFAVVGELTERRVKQLPQTASMLR